MDRTGTTRLDSGLVDYGEIAQSVERSTHNAEVAGSKPVLATRMWGGRLDYAGTWLTGQGHLRRFESGSHSKPYKRPVKGTVGEVSGRLSRGKVYRSCGHWVGIRPGDRIKTDKSEQYWSEVTQSSFETLSPVTGSLPPSFRFTAGGGKEAIDKGRALPKRGGTVNSRTSGERPLRICPGGSG